MKLYTLLLATIFSCAANSSMDIHLLEDGGYSYSLVEDGTQCALSIKHKRSQKVIPLGILTPCDALRYGYNGDGGYAIKQSGGTSTLRIVGALHKVDGISVECGFQWRTIQITKGTVRLEPFNLTEAYGYCPRQEYPKAW